MRYERFEWLTLVVGGSVIVGTVLLWLVSGGFTAAEIVAQLLLFPVLVGAVHWGRRGGFVAAMIAILLYLGMQARLFAAGGLSASSFELIAVRTGIYGFLGIVGGDVCGRMKYRLAEIEDATNVDSATHVYTGRFLAQLLANNLAVHARYDTPFSVALISLSPALTSGLKPARRRSLLRTVANHIRNDVRLVDDVGRLEDGTFLLVLPETHKDGANVAAGRVQANVREFLGGSDGSVQAQALSAPEDVREIESLQERIQSESALQSVS